MSRTFTLFDELKTALAELGPDEILSGVELTPQLAESILGHDPVNRDLRKGRLTLLAREIEGGHWAPRISVPMGFLENTAQMADGQHRCHAVIQTGRSIVVSMRIVPHTVGMDEGLGRTLADHLKIHADLSDKTERDLASTVTKALCRTPSASNRVYLEYFDARRAFIMDCVRKPIAWVADKEPIVTGVFKLAMLAVTRAQEIEVFKEPAADVDELLEDVVNGGATAPHGSPRREYAMQIWDQTQSAFTKKGAKTKDFIKWTRGALKYKREGVMKSAITARFPGPGKKRKKSVAEVVAAKDD